MRRIAILGALVPFVASVAFHMIGPHAQTAARETIARPALAFDQYLVDLGRIQPTKYADGEFAFTNAGKETLKIKELKPSCGCLNPRLEKREYKPGEQGRFFVRVMVPNESPGSKEYTIDVLYDDPQPRETKLVFKVDIPRHVVVRPRALGFYQLGTAATERTVLVTDFRSQPLTVTRVECQSPLVTTSLGETMKDEDGFQHTEIKVVAAGRVPPGTHWADVVIHTNDPTYATLQLPLQIQGPGSGRRTSPAAD